MEDSTMEEASPFDDIEIEPIEPLQLMEPIDEQDLKTPDEVNDSMKTIVDEKGVDVSMFFQTDEVFNTRSDLIEWSQASGKKCKMVVVILKSEYGTPARHPRLILGCERSGTYRRNKKCKDKQDKDARSTGTKKCQCPFLLKGVHQGEDRWKVEVECGTHNHELSSSLLGHSYAGRLTKEEMDVVVNMTKNCVAPRIILGTIKEKNKDNKSTRRTVYNARTKFKLLERQGRIAMEQTMKLPLENKNEEIDAIHAINEDSTIGDGHSIENIQIEPIEPLQEPETPITSPSASDIDGQIEQTVALIEAEKPVASQCAYDVDVHILPLEAPKEVAEKPITSQTTSDMDLQIEPGIPQQEAEKQITSKPTSVEDLQSYENIDMTGTFTTETVFNSRAELIEWARDIGKTVGITVVINKSDKSYPGKKPRVIIGCERGGKYRMNSQRGKPARPSGTKRCGCPFLLKGIKLPKDDQWKVTVACGLHNHPITQDCKGHSYAGKLTVQEKEILVEMAKTGAKPRDVLSALKERNAYNASKLKTIYNARKRMKVDELSRKSQMQQLWKKVVEHEYVEWHHEEEEDSISDLVWAHPASMKLAKCFPHVFLMDSAFKQNKYMPSVLEIVGVTSTYKTFTFAFVYVEAEKEENYIWALERIKLIFSSGTLPSVFVTDREVPLMNAINRVFPEAHNLLCRHNISRDLSTNCKKMFSTNDSWNSFLCRWNDLVFSYTEEEYNDRLSAFEGDFSAHSSVLVYVKETWLSKYKECFVAAWTDQNIHFGNTTITRADNDLTRLKRHLWSSQGSFNTMWTAINSLLLLQHSEINASFNESISSTTMNDYTSMMFDELRGSVSVVALDLILMEAKLADLVGPDSVRPEDHLCECVIRRTHGLPCSHEISRYKYEGRPIPLSCIHSHWKKLSSVPSICPHYELYSQPELQMLCKIYEEADEDVKVQLLQKIKGIVCEPAS